MATVGLTRALAAHVDGITLSRLSADVVAKAKLCVFDTLGCALGGVSHAAIGSLMEAVQPALVDDPSASASVWAMGFRTGVSTAALLNASMAHVVNADDAHKESMGHPGTVVIPTALVVAEMLRSSGAALLEAVVAGYEALLRVGLGIGIASHRERGWYSTSTLGPFGAAAAAAKLMRLGPGGIAGAMGHAGAQASGLWAFTADGSLGNIVYPGRAAESGVLGALLVRSGLPGPARVLEADDGGFLRAMSDRNATESILTDLGRPPLIMDVSLKPYPTSRTTVPVKNPVGVAGVVALCQLGRTPVSVPGWTRTKTVRIRRPEGARCEQGLAVGTQSSRYGLERGGLRRRAGSGDEGRRPAGPPRSGRAFAAGPFVGGDCRCRAPDADAQCCSSPDRRAAGDGGAAR